MNAALPWPSVVSRRRASGASANTEPIGGANITPSAPANRRQDCLEHRPHLRQLLDANHEVPRRFELLPAGAVSEMLGGVLEGIVRGRDRKSTRLNSSHSQISYAVFCLKKKKKIQ